MGMYDHVIYKDKIYQTKDLECELDFYIVRFDTDNKYRLYKVKPQFNFNITTKKDEEILHIYSKFSNECLELMFDVENLNFYGYISDDKSGVGTSVEMYSKWSFGILDSLRTETTMRKYVTREIISETETIENF